MASIYGRESYAIDDKGRITVPPGMRRDAAGTRKPYTRFFLKYGSEGCVQAYPPQDWARLESELRKQASQGPRKRRFVRAFLMDAKWVTVDAQGRITIPPALLRRAGLGKEAVLLGNIDYVEIWNPERFQSAEHTADADVAENEEEFLRGE